MLWKQILEGVAALHNARVDIKFQRGEPRVVNDREMVEIVRKTEDLLGQENTLAAAG